MIIDWSGTLPLLAWILEVRATAADCIGHAAASSHFASMHVEFEQPGYTCWPVIPHAATGIFLRIAHMTLYLCNREYSPAYIIYRDELSRCATAVHHRATQI